MHIHISLHKDHSHHNLLGDISRDLGAALDWLTGPGMTDQDRQELTLADVRNRRFEDSAL